MQVFFNLYNIIMKYKDEVLIISGFYEGRYWRLRRRISLPKGRCGSMIVYEVKLQDGNVVDVGEKAIVKMIHPKDTNDTVPLTSECTAEPL